MTQETEQAPQEPDGQEGTPEPISPMHRFEGVEETPEIYVDAVNMFANNFTLTLVMGTKETTAGGESNVSARTSIIVRMNPLFAANFVNLLKTITDKYEEALRKNLPRRRRQRNQ